MPFFHPDGEGSIRCHSEGGEGVEEVDDEKKRPSLHLFEKKEGGGAESFVECFFSTAGKRRSSTKEGPSFKAREALCFFLFDAEGRECGWGRRSFLLVYEEDLLPFKGERGTGEGILCPPFPYVESGHKKEKLRSSQKR